jgi:hypothetical protein
MRSCARSRKKRRTGRGKRLRPLNRDRLRRLKPKIRIRNSNSRNSLISSERMSPKEIPASSLYSSKMMMKKMSAWL